MAYDRPMDFSDLVYRHLDRMSEMLKHGLEVGAISNATVIMGYYLGTMHFHNMVSMKMKRDYISKVDEYKRKLPTFRLTYTGRPEDNILFMEELSKWFQVLLIVANNEGYITIPIKRAESYDRDSARVIENEDSKPENNPKPS